MKLRKRGSIYSVGVNDADYAVLTTVNGKTFKCPMYRTWSDMLRRCYDPSVQAKQPTYVGCSVAPVWHRFSNFRAWMLLQDWEGNHLDKDLSILGNKSYGPDTCEFVTGAVNKLLTDHRASRGPYPIGVNRNKESSGQKRTYVARCMDGRGGRTFLGYFLTPEEAHGAWRVAKAKTILYVADRDCSHMPRIHSNLTRIAGQLIFTIDPFLPPK